MSVIFVVFLSKRRRCLWYKHYMDRSWSCCVEIICVFPSYIMALPPPSPQTMSLRELHDALGYPPPEEYYENLKPMKRLSVGGSPRPKSPKNPPSFPILAATSSAQKSPEKLLLSDEKEPNSPKSVPRTSVDANPSASSSSSDEPSSESVS